MSENVIIGIDTSNYTTSLGILGDNGELIANIKEPLPVASGERGLRQSEAVFAHIKNIPAVMERAKTFIQDKKVCAIGYSARPRNIEGSYMPCFLVGLDIAKSFSAMSGAPSYAFSHQCGHVMAGIYSSGRFDLLKKEFAAYHVSGGTTELLRVKYGDGGFISELLGGTKDLNAGQVIDRIAVHMGLSFPGGAEMESLAKEFTGKIPKKKVSADGMEINLSGLENLAKKTYHETKDKALVSAFVLNYIGEALKLSCAEYENKFGKSEFLYAGGVMSNSIIKSMLKSSFSASFAEPALSSDNAVGIAYLAYLSYKKSSVI